MMGTRETGMDEIVYIMQSWVARKKILCLIVKWLTVQSGNHFIATRGPSMS
jgi:hypothetical protein